MLRTTWRNKNFPKQKFERIIVTDGPDIENKRKTEITYFSKQQRFFNVYCCSLKEKPGWSAARNKGAQLAKAELIVFADDDLFVTNKLAECILECVMESNHKITAAFTGQAIESYSDRAHRL